MSRLNNKPLFLNAINIFLNRESSSEAFRRLIITLGEVEAEQNHAQRMSWPENYAKNLTEARIRREISEEEFDKKWAQLWGYGEDVQFYNLILKLDLICRTIRYYPEVEIDKLNEMTLDTPIHIVYPNSHRKGIAPEDWDEQLRSEVTRLFDDYQRSKMLES